MKIAKGYVGKWILVEPSVSYRSTYLDRVSCLHVTKETEKQVKCSESKDGRSVRTIQKVNIMQVIKEEDVDAIRKLTREIQQEYFNKMDALFKEYYNKTLKIMDNLK